MINRFGADGFYLLDEPEAALSTQNCLTCLRRIHELVQAGSRFVISTHSPIILSYPRRGDLPLHRSIHMPQRTNRRVKRTVRGRSLRRMQVVRLAC